MEQAATEKRHGLAVEHEAEREQGQVKGMAVAKKAVEGEEQHPRKMR